MAMKLTAPAARTLSRYSRPRAALSLLKSSCSALRSYSTEPPPPPPLLAKLKGDLKAAMKAKDAARLTVLRSVLAATLNASKTNSPIKTDAQLVALLRKTARSSQDARDEANAAGREDLVEKEQAQIQVLEEYVAGSGVESLNEDDLSEIVRSIMSEIAAESIDSKAKIPEAMKRLFAPGGPLDSKDVQKSDVVKAVKELSTNA